MYNHTNGTILHDIHTTTTMHDSTALSAHLLRGFIVFTRYIPHFLPVYYGNVVKLKIVRIME